MKPIAPNTLIQNRYLVVHLIGKGGMGEVYLAVDQRLGSAVALKRTFFSDDEQLGNAFEREARTLARLRHPVLPKVSDHFTEQATQYLVMEHISGEDISKRLETNQKPFPLSWVLFWADHLLDALTYLHTHEPPIVHRDIKPQNLKLTDENNIVLLDFGLSKSSGGETRISTSGSIVGYTPHYAPMEQIRGTGTDARSDIYSLSATLYQILSNVVPADALTRADALISGMEDPIKPLNVINPEVSEPISKVILNGMEVSQDKRFSSARDMQKALRDAFSRSKNEVSSQSATLNKQAGMHIPPSQIVTEVISMPAVAPPVVSIPPQAKNDIYAAKNSAVSPKQDIDTQASFRSNPEPVREFDATLRYDEDIHTSKQSDIRTEVLIAGSSPEITAAQNGYYDKKENDTGVKNFPKEESFDFGNNSAESTDFGANESFSPGATVPLFTLDEPSHPQTPDESFSNYNHGSPDQKDSSAFATYIPQQNPAPAVKPKGQTPAKLPVEKKSSGKATAIAAGVGIFLIFGIGIAAAGWFMFGGNTQTTVIKEEPTPMPQSTIEAVPTPEVTLEVVTESNTNANTSGINSNTSDNSKPQPEEQVTTVKTQPNPPAEQNTKPKQSQQTSQSGQVYQPQQPNRVVTPKQNTQSTTTRPPVVTTKTETPKKPPVKIDRTTVQ